jgi:glucose/arabinose dehydrogenase
MRSELRLGSWVVGVLVASLLGAPRLSLAQGVIIAPLPGATTLSDPLDLVAPHDGSGRLFIVQQGGRLLVYKNGQVLPTPFLDATSLLISGGEQGLLGAAFHPNYPNTPFFYVDYTCRVQASQPECITSGDTIIARFNVSAGNPDVADPASRKILIEIPQPFSNHNAGDLLFGPDDYLWIPMGDGGSGFDPDCRSQRDDSLLGKILRIDVNQNVNTPPYYGIPPDNPYIGAGDPADEVYARGLRNPFRFSFDKQTGDLFIGDVGQNTTEEVDFVPVGTGAAKNFGWKIMEGNDCTNDDDNCPAYVPPCDSPAFTPPILTYGHNQGDCAIIGGFRYRGSLIPSLVGTYLYSDNCTGTLRQATEDGQGNWTGSVLLETGAPISAFGEDQNGELYMTALGGGNGTVYQILPAPPVLSIADVTGEEGTNPGTSVLFFPVTLTASPGQTVTVDYATADGTATAGSDYLATSGTLTFPPSNGQQTMLVPVNVIMDSQHEPDETFFVNLSNPSGATIADDQGVGTILNDDPLPVVTAGDCSVTEGNTGTTPCVFAVQLFPFSNDTVSVSFATASGSAASGIDFVAASGSLTFAPGETVHTVSIDVIGDTLSEPDESFSLNLSAPVNATLGSNGTGTILDDDFGGLPPVELNHGATVHADLALGTPDLYRLAQAPLASYEVILDGVTGDTFPGLQLQRLDPDGVSVLQSAGAVGAGTTLSLRFENTSPTSVLDQRLSVNSPACGAGCGPEDVYRLRAYETTARIARFNNSATQVTIVTLENPGAASVTGTLHFWGASGTPLASQTFGIAPRATLVFASASLPALQGKSGSITVSSDAPYGAISGKAVAVEPATGFTFDSPLEWRPR